MIKPLFTRRVLICSGLIVTLSLFLLSCSSDTKQPKSGHSARSAHLVELSQVNFAAIQHKSQRTGTLKARKTIRIFNQEEGTLTSLPFYEGDHVKKGDVLLKIDDQLLQVQFDKAAATLEQAKQDLLRLQKLRKKRLIAEAEVNRAKTALNIAEAEQRLLATRLGYTSVKAPIDGTISERRAEIGDVAPRHTHLLSLIDIRTLITEVAVSDLLMSSLQVGDNVDVRIDALPDQISIGRILRIHPTLNPSTRNGIIDIILDPAPIGARPGQFCRVTLLSKLTNRLLIPFKALRQDKQGSYVYVVDDSNIISRRAITTGLRFDDRIEILSGLKAKQMIVVKGFLGLKTGKTIRTADSTKMPK